MKNSTSYKVLVLLGLTDQSVNVLKSATRMAQIIGGDLELFHVRKPTKVVERESHLSAVRVIKDHYVLVENELKAMCDSVHKNFEVKADHFFAFGNIKNEIENHIKKTKPDIVVVGKRVSKTPNFLGDNIVPFVLKKFKGVVMVADNDNVLEAERKLSLGLFNSGTIETDHQFIDTIISNTESPICSFEVANSVQGTRDKSDIMNKKVVSYVFEKNGQTLKTMSNYMDKNKVNLLFVNRKPRSSTTTNSLSISEMNNLAHNLKVPLLLFNK